MASRPGRSRHNERLLSALTFDRNNDIIQGIANSCERQSLFARGVIIAAVAELPVMDDF